MSGTPKESRERFLPRLSTVWVVAGTPSTRHDQLLPGSKRVTANGTENPRTVLTQPEESAVRKRSGLATARTDGPHSAQREVSIRTFQTSSVAALTTNPIST